MANLRSYLHAPIPAPLTDDRVAVVDLRSYLAKIDREYATQRYAETDAPLLYIRIQIGKATCSALIDCGASRNFMSQAFMARAGLGPRVRRKTQPTQVTLADGRTQRSIDRCIDGVPIYFAPLACEPVSFDILDTKFDMILGMSWLRSTDHPVNFHDRTVHVRDRNGVLVPCTVATPHTSIACHVVSVARIRDAIARNDVEEMGIVFLHALPSPNGPAASPPDPRITHLLDGYGDVFEAPIGTIPDRPIRHGITLEAGVVPPRGCIYRMGEEELEVLRVQLDDLLDKGWIRPSCSPYGVPVLFVRKKNKDLRLCIDYRKLNAQTVKNAGPLPRIDDLLERLGGAAYFLKLDLKSGYHQIEIQPQDRYKTAFKTWYGHFEWVVMPFGLTNAPTTFQAAMTTEFRDLVDCSVLIYLDDILVYSRTLDEHLVHLRVVLDRLRAAKYKENHDKCEFAKQEFEYLGHYVTPKGIRPLADKIQAIMDWPEPRCTTDVRSFMGLAGYYQRFVKSYSKVAAPLSRLQSSKVPFEFDDAARGTFNTLKAAMQDAPALRIYDPTLPTQVTTDASGWNTDNNLLTFYKTQDTDTSTIGQWMYYIDQFDFAPCHIPGPANRAADALSRRPDLCALVTTTFDLDDDLQQHFVNGYKSDPTYSTLYTDLSSDHPPANHYRISDGFLLLHTRGKDLLVVPQDRILRTRLLGEFHDARLLAHLGVNRTLARLRQRPSVQIPVQTVFSQSPLQAVVTGKLAILQPAQPQGTQPQQQQVQQPAAQASQPGVAQVPEQGQWVPKTAIASPKPFTGDKKGDDLDTWLRTVPVYVKFKLTLPHEEVLVAASYLEGSAARWLSRYVQLQGYGHDFRAWAVTQKLDDFIKLVEERWHDPQEAQNATDGILTLSSRKIRLQTIPIILLKYRPYTILTSISGEHKRQGRV
ncbi:hypothetical protein CBR_g23248 [Chara braunii]|uniref:Reverse transcriptase domain-containing protein n=1 Tax=Chara braunii TaxID=69332 RepID=A0A388JVF2_CHABU|nr:hypothetical protein CBR_g23248 [Chara braunii]|eukprot:GBG61733.1 hypothetical protein CBR_g23248 [Chara braunii]